jgi:hypothetical protein
VHGLEAVRGAVAAINNLLAAATKSVSPSSRIGKMTFSRATDSGMISSTAFDGLSLEPSRMRAAEDS